ncbi:MAG: Crp/Fnr family transcriptional regulator [Burkholderiales bacterium]
MDNAPTDFLGQLAGGERATLMKIAKRRRLARGEFAFRVGDAKQGTYVLLRGRLKFFRLTPDGHEVILWFCFPGEVFGMSEVPAAKGRRVNVEACEASEVGIVSDAAFNRFLDDHPDAGRSCRRTMAARLGLLTNMLVNLVADDAYARVAKLVLHLGLHYGDKQDGQIKLQIPLTHQELAGMAGVNRQTVTRILGDLKKRKIISLARRGFCIESEPLLYQAIHGDPVRAG